MAIWSCTAYSILDSTSSEMLLLNLLQMIDREILRKYCEDASLWFVGDHCNGLLNGHRLLNYRPIPKYIQPSKPLRRKQQIARYKKLMKECVDKMNGHNKPGQYNRKRALTELVTHHLERTQQKGVSAELSRHLVTGSQIGQTQIEYALIDELACVLKD
eukprot:101532_1